MQTLGPKRMPCFVFLIDWKSTLLEYTQSSWTGVGAKKMEGVRDATLIGY